MSLEQAALLAPRSNRSQARPRSMVRWMRSARSDRRRGRDGGRFSSATSDWAPEPGRHPVRGRRPAGDCLRCRRAQQARRSHRRRAADLSSDHAPGVASRHPARSHRYRRGGDRHRGALQGPSREAARGALHPAVSPQSARHFHDAGAPGIARARLQKLGSPASRTRPSRSSRMRRHSSPTHPIACLSSTACISGSVPARASVSFVAPRQVRDRAAAAMRAGGWIASSLSMHLVLSWISDGTGCARRDLKRNDARVRQALAADILGDARRSRTRMRSTSGSNCPSSGVPTPSSRPPPCMVSHHAGERLRGRPGPRPQRGAHRHFRAATEGAGARLQVLRTLLSAMPTDVAME